MMEKTLLLLIAVGVCKSDHVIKQDFIWIVDDYDRLLRMNWSEARKSCAFYSSEMLTLDLATENRLKNITDRFGIVWMGLKRDQQNDSAWNWINTTMVEPTSGDVSQILNWSEEGHSSHCVFLSEEATWSSKRCDEKQTFLCSINNDIYYNQTKLSWQDARSQCQAAKGDLSIKNRVDEDGNGWIGVYREGGGRWVDTGGASVGDHVPWAQGEPVTNDCGAYDAQEKRWKSYPCSARLNVICHEDNLLVVPEVKTWEEAMEHCRSLTQDCTNRTCLTQHQLLTVESASDYAYVRKRIYGATTDEVWTGLRFLGGHWWWANREWVKDDRHLPQCPAHGHHCGVVSKTNNTPWLTADCAKKLSFVCYKITTTITKTSGDDSAGSDSDDDDSNEEDH